MQISRILEEARYWELRKEKSTHTSVRTWNKEIKELATSESSGTSVRVLVNNGWGFAHSTNNDIDVLANQALKIAKAMNAHANTQNVHRGKPIKANKTTSVKINPEDIDIEQKKKLVLEAFQEKKHISSTQLGYSDSKKVLLYENSEGSHIEQTLYRTHVLANITAKDVGMESYYGAAGATKGFEFAQKHMQSTTDHAMKEAILQLKAIVPKGGRAPIIADPGLTDVFVHEAVGHSAEADLVLQKQTCLEGHKNKQIAPDFVTIVDDGSIPGSWGSYFYDDEGIKALKTEIIKKGKLNSLIHSRLTAVNLNGVPTGNARAQNVSHQPIVRMSNTYIEKGHHSFKELLEELKNGFLLVGSRGGQVDAVKGNFQFACQTGYVVKNGELQDRLKGVSIGGHTLKTLNDIKAISNSYESGTPGFCGKDGQSVPVIGNCPHLLIGNVQVGGK